MEVKVISIINYKGGVGKSTVAFNLGAELASENKKVLLIDFDGQGNLSKFSGVKTGDENIITMLNEVIKGMQEFDDPIHKISKNLDIITCDIKKENWSIRALSELARETILKRYIDKVKDKYDYDFILIDNAPSVNLDFQNSLVASDYYLIVTEPETGSSDGIYTVNSVIRQIKECFNNTLKPAGVLINKVQERTTLHRFMNDVIIESWGEDIYVFDTTIPNSIVAPESEFLEKSIGSYNKNSKIGLAFKAFSKEFIDRVGGE